MPVTAVLSKKFYEKFGEDVTNELVNWFNSVDATYRANLRELNEANFGRFDAKLGERLAELESKLDRRVAQAESRLLGWMVGVTLAVWIPTGVGILTLLFR